MTSNFLKSYLANQQNPKSNQDSQEIMLVQNEYRSPERQSYKYSTKQSPKSILKESSSYSEFKPRKEIIINEMLNQTRKLSLRSESIGSLKEKGDNITENNERSYEEDAKNIIETSYKRYKLNKSTSKKKRKTSERYKTIERASLNYLYPERPTEFQEELLDFQKAYIRSLQREREREIYSDLIQKSNSSLGSFEKTDPGYLYENANTKKSSISNENKQMLEDLRDQREILDRKSSVQSLGNFSNLDHVEEKIYNLEKKLDIYSHKLKESMKRQNEHLKNQEYIPLKKRGWGENQSYLKTQQIENKSARIDNQNNKERNMRLIERKEYDERDNFSKKHSNSNWNYDYQENNANPTSDQKKNYICEEDDSSTAKLSNQPNRTHMTLYQLNSTSKVQKETELQKTIEQVRNKLHNSMINRTINGTHKGNLDEDEKKIKSYQKQIQKNILPKKVKPITTTKKARKAYGNSILERENSCSLYEGISSSYNGFHWNADQSLKLTRKI